jgi:acrylyl-CoA reductase (NADPH)
MTSFKALRVHRDEGGIRAAIDSLDLDALSAGEVVFQVHWSAINYKDALAATGAGRIMRDLPRIGGIDASGVVTDSTDPRFKAGDPVLVTGFDFGVGHDGGFAEYARVPADWLVPLPNGLDLRQAMILGTAGFTVGLGLKRLADVNHDPALGPMLVTGASGGVGSLAVSLLAKHGYQVHALTGKAAQADWLRGLGAAEVLLRQELALGGRPLEPGRFGGGFDTLGGPILGWLLASTREWGSVVACGLAAGHELPTTVMPFILRGVSLLGVTSVSCPQSWREAVWQQLASDWQPAQLDAMVHREVTLDELPGVFGDFLQAKSLGRTLVRIAACKLMRPVIRRCDSNSTWNCHESARIPGQGPVRRLRRRGAGLPHGDRRRPSGRRPR